MSDLVLHAIKELKVLENIENLEKLEKTEKKTRRKFWVNPFLLKRELFDLEAHLLKDLLWEEKEYSNFCRMSIGKFEELLSMVGSSISKTDTRMRNAISARNRLAITLRFVATGDSYRSLEFLSRISRKTIGKFVPEVLCAIYDALQPLHMKVPDNTQSWQEVAQEFHDIWWFPHTLGAVDGKHIRITAPAHSGSTFYNFKGFFSIILFAVADAHSRFLYINVGANGKSSDSTIFQQSTLYKKLMNHSLKIPDPSPLSDKSADIPYYFIADDAFSLASFLMKPFNRNIHLTLEQEVFNYRICRARMCIEMAFGRLANRFRIFHKPIEVSPETCDKIIKACCVMHNFLTVKRTCPVELEDLYTEPLPQNFSPIGTQHYYCPESSNRIRDKVASYCVSEGNVPIQWKKITQ